MRPAPDGAPLTSRRDGASIEVQPAGELDMAATFRLEPQVERLLAEDGVRRLVLNLAEVRFIDSAGIGALLSIRERTERLSVEMALTNVPAPVQRVLELTGTGAQVEPQATADPGHHRSSTPSGSHMFRLRPD
jgi:anti-sigma B factor antagonist